MTNSIKFSGLNGKVLKSSPHGNFQVVQLSKRVVICGTFSNKFNWSEIPEHQSGFISFITYIGCKSKTEHLKLRKIVQTLDGHCEDVRTCGPAVSGESKVRKRVRTAIHF